MGLAADPEQLVDGMADFIREVGYGTSFLDMEDVEKEPLWNIITRAVINPYSFERGIFQSNLMPVIEENTRLHQEQQERARELARKQRRLMALDGEYTASPSPVRGAANATASKFEISLQPQQTAETLGGDASRVNVSADQANNNTTAQPANPAESPSILPRNASRDPRDFREIGDRLSSKKSDLVEIKKKLNQLARQLPKTVEKSPSSKSLLNQSS